MEDNKYDEYIPSPHEQDGVVIDYLSGFSHRLNEPIRHLSQLYQVKIASRISTSGPNDKHCGRSDDELVRNIKKITTTQLGADGNTEIVGIYHNHITSIITTILSNIYIVKGGHLVINQKEIILNSINLLKNERLTKEEYITRFLYTRELCGRYFSPQSNSITQLLRNLQDRLKEYDERSHKEQTNDEQFKNYQLETAQQITQYVNELKNFNEFIVNDLYQDHYINPHY